MSKSSLYKWSFWQWIILYIILGAVIYLTIYVFFIKQKNYSVTPEGVTKQYQQVSQTSSPSAASPTQPPETPIPGWNVYQTNRKMDIHDTFFTLYPTLRTPTLSVQYPSSWQLTKLSPQTASYAYHNTSIPLGFELIKQDPQYANCGSEGPCENSASIQFQFGIVPQRLTDFDSDYWGRGFLIEKQVPSTIHGISVAHAYVQQTSPYPHATIFFLSPTTQLYVFSTYNNYHDTIYSLEFSKTTVDEINKIISSITLTQ